MEKDFDKLLEYWRTNDGTGKLFNFKFIQYKKGYLKLEAEFSPITFNPQKNVQGGNFRSSKRTSRCKNTCFNNFYFLLGSWVSYLLLPRSLH